MLLAGRVAIVTGAASGIGLATVHRFVGEGARVVLADLDEKEATRRAHELAAGGGVVRAVRADVADRESVEEMVRTAESAYGRLDILVNNAGIAGRAAPIEEQTDRDWDSMIAIDLKSVFLCCRAAIPVMKEQGYGRIINVASIAGKEGNPNMVPYSAAKAGVIGLTKALAKEVGTQGILVNAVSPAVIDTSILRQLTQEQVDYMVQRIPLGRTGKPEEVAALITWLASDEASFTTGQCLDISGGRATY